MINLQSMTKLVLEYNEVLIKYIKGQLWFDDPKTTIEMVEKNQSRWYELVNDLAARMEQLENLSYEFEGFEALEGLKVPEELKREDIERWLEGWAKHKKEL